MTELHWAAGLVLALPPNTARLLPISRNLIGNGHVRLRHLLCNLFVYTSVTFCNKFNWLKNEIDNVESIKVQVCGIGLTSKML